MPNSFRPSGPARSANKQPDRRPPDRGRRLFGQAAWALYDWAISPFPTLIVTFVFAAYFQQAVVGDAVEGQALWSLAIALGGLGFSLTAPFLGAVADARGGLKPWIFSFTVACALASAGLWFVAPDPGFAILALVLLVVGMLASEYAEMFLNALLPGIVGPSRLGRLSGWAWGLGYVGGIAALLIALALLIRPEVPPFGLDAGAAEQVRMVGPLVGAWLLVFSAPLFLLTPDRRPRGAVPAGAVRAGLRDMVARLKALPRQRDLLRFLLAHMLYNNGLLTLFGLGGVYAAGVFGMSLDEVIVFGIALNVAAGLGAFGFGFVDDRIGSRASVMLALAGLIVSASVAVMAPDRTWFWAAGIGIGLFVGPVQASSRALMARMTTETEAAGHFGLFALSGRATAFLGPAVAAAVTAFAGSQRLGIATILLFLVAGLALLLGVREPARVDRARSTA
jgi:MFS transporter, UMF1 family